MYNTIEKMFDVVMMLVACAFIAVAVLGFERLSAYFAQSSIVGNATELEIVDVENVITSFKECYTIFVVKTEEGSSYTLPQVRTASVREYHEGDLLPVYVSIDEKGNHRIQINTSALAD